MAVGQVGFKDPKKVLPLLTHLYYAASDVFQVKKIHVAQRENHIVNRLNKNKEEPSPPPNLRQAKEDRQKQLRQKERAAQQSRVSAELDVPSYCLNTLSSVSLSSP